MRNKSFLRLSFLLLIIALGSLFFFHHLQPDSSEIPSQNGYYHLGVAELYKSQTGDFAEALLKTSPNGTFVDQHALFHWLIVGAEKTFPSLPPLYVVSSIGLTLAVLSIFIFLSLNCSLSLAVPFSFASIFIFDLVPGRLLAGRPASYSLAFFFVLLCMAQKRIHSLFYFALLFLWAGFGYVSLIALPVLILLTPTRTAILGALGLILGLGTFGGIDTFAHLWATLVEHLGPHNRIYEWSPPRAEMFTYVLLILTSIYAWRKSASKPYHRHVAALALVLSLSSLLVSRLIEIGAPLAIACLAVALNENLDLSKLRRWAVSIAIGLFTVYKALTPSPNHFSQQAYSGDPVAFFTASLPHTKGKPVLLFDWTLWSAAFYVDLQTQIEPGFSPQLYRRYQTDRWTSYERFFDLKEIHQSDVEKIARQWKTRLFVFSERHWQSVSIEHREQWRILTRDTSYILAQAPDIPSDDEAPSAELVQVSISQEDLCRSYSDSIDFLLSKAEDLIAREGHVETWLTRLRRQSALVALCSRPDLWSPTQAHRAESLCSQIRSLLENAITKTVSNPSSYSPEILLPEVWSRTLRMPDSENRQKLQKLIAGLNDGDRLWSRLAQVRGKTNFKRDDTIEIFGSGHFALLLALDGESSRERLIEFSKKYYEIYKTEFQHSIFFVRWWAEAMGRLDQDQSSKISDRFLEEFHRGLMTMKMPNGCLGPQVPGMPRFEDPHHVSGLVLSGLLYGKKTSAPWWSEDFSRLHDGLLSCVLSLQEHHGENKGMFKNHAYDGAFYPDVHEHLMAAVSGHLSIGACKSP